MGAAGFATFVNLYATQSLLPTLAAEFGTSLAEVGLTITVPLVAIAFVAPLVGGISDALGRRRLIVGAAGLLVVPTVLSGFAPGLGTLLLCRLAQGLLLPFIFAVTVAYIAEERPGAAGVRGDGVIRRGHDLRRFRGPVHRGLERRNCCGWRAAFLSPGHGVTTAGSPRRLGRVACRWSGTVPAG